MRELIKDTCLERSLRHDLFVRGARRMNPAIRDATLMDVSLALKSVPKRCRSRPRWPAGRAELNRAFYGPITEALAAGPRRVDDLLNCPTLEGKRDNPSELIGILLGLDLAEPAYGPGRRTSAPGVSSTVSWRPSSGAPTTSDAGRRRELRAWRGRAVQPVRPVRAGARTARAKMKRISMIGSGHRRQPGRRGARPTASGLTRCLQVRRADPARPGRVLTQLRRPHNKVSHREVRPQLL